MNTLDSYSLTISWYFVIRNLYIVGAKLFLSLPNMWRRAKSWWIKTTISPWFERVTLWMLSMKVEASSISDKKSLSLQRDMSIFKELITTSEFLMLPMQAEIDYLTPFKEKNSFNLFFSLLISHISKNKFWYWASDPGWFLNVLSKPLLYYDILSRKSPTFVTWKECLWMESRRVVNKCSFTKSYLLWVFLRNSARRLREDSETEDDLEMSPGLIHRMKKI